MELVDGGPAWKLTVAETGRTLDGSTLTIGPIVNQCGDKVALTSSPATWTKAS